MKLPIEAPPHFKIIAHRGASGYAPENTRAAFKLAQQMGIKHIELDTQLSTDQKVVICHDTTLEKYGYGSQVVEEMAWDDLALLDMGRWFSPFLFPQERLLTLPDLFQEFATSLVYHIEIKGQAPLLPQRIYQEIERFDLASHCIITSFSYQALATMRKISPSLRLGWLVHHLTADVLDKAQSLDLYQLCPRADKVQPTEVKQARTIVKEIRAWGINGSRQEIIDRILNVIAVDCDGMTINWPDWVRPNPVDRAENTTADGTDQMESR